MIDLYTWPTPNGRKVSIALEEMDLEYRCHAVNLQEQEQFKPEFLAISPNNKIPALVDHHTGQSLMESGAILIYLADKCGEFWGDERYTTLQWLMWQMGGLGPMLGQVHYFKKYNAGKSEQMPTWRRAPGSAARSSSGDRSLAGALGDCS